MSEWRSIASLVTDAAVRFGDAEAVVDPPIRLNFGELAAEIHDAARATIAAGITPGDRVAIWAPNSWEWIVAALGAVSAGAVLVPINTRFKGREAADILARSGARLLHTVSGFLGTDYVGMLREACAGAGDKAPVAGLEKLEAVVVLRGDAPEGTIPWGPFVAGDESVPELEVRARADTIALGDLSDIIFTSGTTGKPKGVMTTHGQTLETFDTWSHIVGLREGDRYLIVNPFFHTFGYKAGILACLMRGATILPHPVFDVSSVLRRVAEERVTMLPGPPTLYQSILDHPERGVHDLSSLRLAVTGAAVVPVEMIRRMRSELTFQTILTAYGLTEATGVVTMCREGDDAVTIATTSGRAIPGVEVRIVEDGGNEAARGEPGEIVVRGSNVTQGYLDDPEATAEAIRDGWLHTGDIGVMDARDNIRITDRLKDMFVVGGFNASPAEIENALLEHSSIGQAAVVGVPDARLGEVGVAFVVPRAGATVDPEAVLAWAKERMANYKVPRRVEIVETLPVNAAGKVLKHELRERAQA
jgi:HIP---CoA ligase